MVQITSGIQRFSYDIVREMISGLQFILYSYSRPDLRSLLSRRGDMTGFPHLVDYNNSSEQDRPIPKLSELRGLGAKKITGRGEFDPLWTLNASIDTSKCVNCGSCALSCRDCSVEAIARTNEGNWVVDSDKCMGCGLCLSVCPVGAIKLTEIQKQKVWHHPDMVEWSAAKQN